MPTNLEDAFRAANQIERVTKLAGLLGGPNYSFMATDFKQASRVVALASEQANKISQIVAFVRVHEQHMAAITEASKMFRENSPAYSAIRAAGEFAERQSLHMDTIEKSLSALKEARLDLSRIGSVASLANPLADFQSKYGLYEEFSGLAKAAGAFGSQSEILRNIVSFDQALRPIGFGGNDGQTERFFRDDRYLSVISQTRDFVESLRTTFDFPRTSLHGLPELLAAPVPEFPSISAYDRFLRIGGLGTERGAKDSGEKAKSKFSALMESRRASAVEVAAFEDIFSLEAALRILIGDALKAEFGDNWHETILPECGCKDLLGRHQKRGGTPLEHADWAHLLLLVRYQKVFFSVFSRGFGAHDDLVRSFAFVAELRRAPMHAKKITPSQLMELKAKVQFIQAGCDQL